MQFHVSSWQVLSIPYYQKELWSADNAPELQSRSFGVLLQSLALQLWDPREKPSPEDHSHIP